MDFNQKWEYLQEFFTPNQALSILVNLELVYLEVMNSYVFQPFNYEGDVTKKIIKFNSKEYRLNKFMDQQGILFTKRKKKDINMMENLYLPCNFPDPSLDQRYVYDIKVEYQQTEAQLLVYLCEQPNEDHLELIKKFKQVLPDLTFSSQVIINYSNKILLKKLMDNELNSNVIDQIKNLLDYNTGYPLVSTWLDKPLTKEKKTILICLLAQTIDDPLVTFYPILSHQQEQEIKDTYLKIDHFLFNTFS